MSVHTRVGCTCRTALRSGPAEASAREIQDGSKASAAFLPVILLELDRGIEEVGGPAIVYSFGCKWELDRRPFRRHVKTTASDVHRAPAELPLPLLFGDPGKGKDNGVPYRSRTGSSRFFGSSLVPFNATVRGTIQPGALSYCHRENR
jgi:hypothetical protein